MLQYSWLFRILTSAPEEEPPRSHSQATHWRTNKTKHTDTHTHKKNAHAVSSRKAEALLEKITEQNAASKLLNMFQKRRKKKSQKIISRLKSSLLDERDIKEFIKPILRAKMIILNIPKEQK